MTVRDLITKLAEYPPDAEVHYPTEGGVFSDSVEIDHIYESSATYGILNTVPTTVKTVVLCSGTEGI